jgi:hypothetical protein
MDPNARAEGLVRATRGIADAALRVAYLSSVLRETDVAELAPALDLVCGRAEQAEEAAREVLVSLVDALNGVGAAPYVQRLREQAAGDSLLALERLVRHPLLARPQALPTDPN